jgi:hypothetical protein
MCSADSNRCPFPGDRGYISVMAALKFAHFLNERNSVLLNIKENVINPLALELDI